MQTPSSKKKRPRQTRGTSRHHKEIMAAVDQLPALLMEEMREQQPKQKTVAQTAPPSSPRIDLKDEQKKNRILIGSVAFLASIVCGMWFLNATNLIDRWQQQPKDTTAFFQNSQKQLNDILGQTKDKNRAAIEQAMKTAFAEAEKQIETEMLVTHELETMFRENAEVSSTASTTSNTLATSSEDMVLSPGNEN